MQIQVSCSVFQIANNVKDEFTECLVVNKHVESKAVIHADGLAKIVAVLTIFRYLKHIALKTY